MGLLALQLPGGWRGAWLIVAAAATACSTKAPAAPAGRQVPPEFAQVGLPLASTATQVPALTWSEAGFGHVPASATLTPLEPNRVLITGVSMLGDSQFRMYDGQLNRSWVLSATKSPRKHHAASRLTDGRVLVSGGSGDWGVTDTAEIFDPATGTSKPIGSMQHPRCRHASVLLGDGRVLVAGGTQWAAPVEVVDPGTGTFVDGELLQTAPQESGCPACGMRGTRLANGDVLLVEACTNAASKASQLWQWSAATGQLTALPALPVAMTAVSAAELPNGNLLLGGYPVQGEPVGVFDRALGTYGTPPLGYLPARVGATADGKLVLGPSTWGMSRPAAVLDPISTVATDTPELDAMHVVAVPGGDVLAVGRLETVTVAQTWTVQATPGDCRYRAQTKTVEPLGARHHARIRHTETRMGDGRVLVVGGQSGATGELVQVDEVCAPLAQTCTFLSTPEPGRFLHSATLLSDGQVLVVAEKSAAAALRFDPTKDTWSVVASPAVATSDHAAVALASGKVAVIGGSVAGVPRDEIQIFDAATSTWTVLGKLRVARRGATAAQLADGRVVVLGGASAYDNGRSVEWFDPVSGNGGTWTSLQVPRFRHHMASLGGERWLLTAQFSESIWGSWGSNDPLEIWSAASGTSQLLVGLGSHLSLVAAPLPGQGLLLCGVPTLGFDAPRCERLDTSTLALTPHPSPPWLADGGTLTPMVDGRIHYSGGVHYACSEGVQCATPDALYQPRAALGDACQTDTDCQSGHCAAGWCCATACATPPAGCYAAIGQCQTGSCTGYLPAVAPTAPVLEPVADGKCGGSAPVMKWGPVAGARYRVTLNGKVVATDLAAATWSPDPGVALAAQNTWSVAAVGNCAGATATSAESSFAWTAAPLTTPALTSPAPNKVVSGCSAHLTWTAASADAVYDVTDGGQVVATGIAATSFDLSGLAALADGPHTLGVVARNCLGQTAASPPVAVTAASQVPMPELVMPSNKLITNSAAQTVKAALPGPPIPGAKLGFDLEHNGKVTRTWAAASSAVVTLDPGPQRVRAVALGCAGSETVSPWVDVVLDDVPPLPFIELLPKPQTCVGTNTSSVQVAWEPSGDAETGLVHYLVQIDNVTVQTLPPDATATVLTFNKPLPTGMHVVGIVAEDAAGNQASANSGNITFDNKPPMPPMNLQPSGVGKTAPVWLSWSPSQDFQCGIDHYDVVDNGAVVGTTPAWAWQWPVTGWSKGPHVWFVQAVDRGGNVSQSYDYAAINIDPDAPTSIALVSTTPASADGVYTTSAWPAMVFAVDDGPLGSGVKGLQVAVSGASKVIPATVTPCPTVFCPINTVKVDLVGKLSDGVHTWTATATDRAGNVSPTASGTFAVDSEPPAAADLLTPPVGAVLATPVPTLCWNVAAEQDTPLKSQRVLVFDAQATQVVNLALAATLGTQCATLTPPGLVAGNYTWTVELADAASLTSTALPRPLQLQEDATPPTVDLIGPPDLPWQGTATVAVNWQPVADFSGICQLAVVTGGVTQPLAVTATSWQGAVADGEQAVQVVATDCAGNTAWATVTAHVDTAPPTVAKPAAPGCGSVAGATVTSTCSDAASGVVAHWLVVDGVPLPAQPTGVDLATSALSPGLHSAAVGCADAVGHVAVSPATTWQVDGTQPSVVGVILAATNDGLKCQVKAMDVGCGVAQVQVQWDGGGWTAAENLAGTFQWAALLAVPGSGAHSLGVQVVDAVGLSTSASLKVQYGPCFALGACDMAAATCGQPLSNGTPCNDGNPCTATDACSNGACWGKALDCDDGNPATTDGCIAGECHAGVPGGTCVTAADCNDGLACTKDWCLPALKACLFEADSSCCADGGPCPAGEICVAGACVADADSGPDGEGDAVAAAEVDDAASEREVGWLEIDESVRDVAQDLGQGDEGSTGPADEADAPAKANDAALGDHADGKGGTGAGSTQTAAARDGCGAGPAGHSHPAVGALALLLVLGIRLRRRQSTTAAAGGPRAGRG